MIAVRITKLLKIAFKEYYDIKQYRNKTEAEFAVKRYKLNNQKKIVNEEESNE